MTPAWLNAPYVQPRFDHHQSRGDQQFRVINRYVGNLPPMPGVFPDYPAPVVRNSDHGSELVTMRWGMPPPPRTGGPPVTNIRHIRHIVFGRTADYAEGQAGFDHSGRSKPKGYAMRKVLYIFGLLSDADVSWIAKTGIQRRLQDGDVLIRE